VNLDVEEEGKKTLKSAIGAEEDDYVPEGMKDKRPKETLAREKEKSQIPKDDGPDDQDLQPKEGRKNAKKGEGGDDEEGEEDEEDQDKEGKRPQGKGRKPGESTKEPQRDGKKGPTDKAPENKGSKDTAGVDGKQPEDSKNAPSGGSEDTSSSSNGKPGEDARNGVADRAATSSTPNDPNSPANGGGGNPNGLYADRPQQPCNNFARLTPENVDAWKEAKPCPKSNSGNGLGGRSRRDSGGSKPGKIWFFGSDSAAKGKAKEDRPIEYWDQFIDGNGKDVNTQTEVLQRAKNFDHVVGGEILEQRSGMKRECNSPTCPEGWDSTEEDVHSGRTCAPNCNHGADGDSSMNRAMSGASPCDPGGSCSK